MILDMDRAVNFLSLVKKIKYELNIKNRTGCNTYSCK